MSDLKIQLQQKLVANVLIDKCSVNKNIIFCGSWCTQERVIRFTTPFFRSIIQALEDGSGYWKTGDSVMYEVVNTIDSLVVNCVFCPTTSTKTGEKLLTACKVIKDNDSANVVLKSWDITQPDGDVNKLFDAFDLLLDNTIPLFEQELGEKMKHAELFNEGSAVTITSNKYERNPKARAACLAAHGTACAVCGIDFGKVYGPEFSNKIEVHHIVPISEIGKQYNVDPINDLVPVCPNCHTALHTKESGVYSIEELKKKIKK